MIARVASARPTCWCTRNALSNALVIAAVIAAVNAVVKLDAVVKLEIDRKSGVGKTHPADALVP